MIGGVEKVERGGDVEWLGNGGEGAKRSQEADSTTPLE